MSKKIVAAAGLACILAFGTCGCSVSSTSESTSTLETSVTDDQGNTTTTTTTTNSDGTTTETVKSLSMDEWVDAWTGKSDTGYEVYFAQSPDAKQGLFVLYNKDKDDTEVFIGDEEVPEEGLVTVYGQDGSFTFQIQEADEDHNNVTIWGGDDYGTATIKRCTLDDLIQGVHKFDPDGKIINIGTDDDD